MIVQVDLGPPRPIVTLEEPDDCNRFHVAVVGGTDVGRVYGALVDAAAGRVEGDHAIVTIDAVRRLASGRVSADWEDRFVAMLEYARANGWIDATGYAIQAHIEHPPG